MLICLINKSRRKMKHPNGLTENWDQGKIFLAVVYGCSHHSLVQLGCKILKIYLLLIYINIRFKRCERQSRVWFIEDYQANNVVAMYYIHTWGERRIKVQRLVQDMVEWKSKQKEWNFRGKNVERATVKKKVCVFCYDRLVWNEMNDLKYHLKPSIIFCDRELVHVVLLFWISSFLQT